MKIAIIEDEPCHIDLLSKYLQAWSKQRQVRLEIRSFTSAECFLFYWEEDKNFDVLFVDIQMKEMNGMDMAKKVREKDGHIKIIFTTGISDYLEEGYDVEAMYYLIKPISEEKIQRCMDKAVCRTKVERFLLVNTKEGMEKLSLENINYVEARGHGCIIEVIAGESGFRRAERLEVTESISELGHMLQSEDFIRCHRSYICRIGNIHHMDKLEKRIFFDIGSPIPVSRRLYGEVNQAFVRYFRRM